MNKLLKKPLLLIVLINTVLAFIIDFYLASTVSWKYLLVILLIELPLIYVLTKTFDNKKWALIISAIYYLIRSFNFYFDNFTFYTKNGFNIELGIGNIGVNLVSLIMLVLLIIYLDKKSS